MKVASFFKRYKVKQRDGRVYDPIREKYVHATPEEYVRQKTIQFLVKIGNLKEEYDIKNYIKSEYTAEADIAQYLD